MNKNIIIAMLIVFMAVKNPMGFAGIKVVNAEPQKVETSAFSEADIAKNIYSAYEIKLPPSSEELAKAQLAQYQKSLASKRAKLIKEKQTQVIIVRETIRKVPVNLAALYAAAEAKYGVPRQILAAVHMVESGQRGDTYVSSYAGAQGPMQFMPSTFRAYAQDGDGDGIASISDVHDAVYTAAKYLAANGAASGRITGALYRYNHDSSYVYKVLSIARSYGYRG